MRFIVVSPKRLNVYLSKIEAESENISIEKLANETYNVKEKLGGVFSRAFESTGFDCSDTKLKIEVIPLTDGDILISIMKIKGSGTGFYLKNKILVFEFESFDNLADALLSSDKYYIGRESVYKFEGKYFLVLYLHKIRFSDINMLKLIILEYGFESVISHMVLKEHGRKIICGNGGYVIKNQYCKNG